MKGNSQQEEKLNAKNRRKFLKTAGVAAVTAASTPAITSATKPDSHDVYEQSLKLRDQNDWDVYQWRRYLVKRGHNLKTHDKTFTGRSGVSTQRFDCYQCTLFVTFDDLAYEDYAVVDFSWEIDQSDSDDGGQAPLDYATIGYDSDHYSKNQSPYVYYGNYVSDIADQDSEGATGIAVEWDDEAYLNNEGSDGTASDYWGMYLIPNYSDYDEWERKIYVDLHHIWGDIKLDSVGFSTTGPTLNLTSGTEKWVRETETFEGYMDEGGQHKDTRDKEC